MNKIIIRDILFISIFDVILQMSNCKRIPQLEENFFYVINTRLQDTVNKLFILTKLNKTFATDYTNRMHLTMHASMKSIAEKYYVSLIKTNTSSRVDLNFKPNYTLFNLDETLDDLLKKESTLYYTKKYIKKMPKLFSKSKNFKFRDKSEDPILFLREYLSTIKHLDLGELAAPTQHIHKMFLNLTKSRNRRRKMDLSLWKPRIVSEFSNYETRRLYNGRRTRIKSYPFVVSIHLRNKFICTGSILSTQMVITAASCLHELFKNKLFLHLNPQSVGIRVGSEFVDKLGLWVYIDKVFFNPTYNPTTLTGNLVIMRTNSLLHLKKKNRRVKRIDYLRTEGHPRSSINTIVMLGWGDINMDKQEPIKTPLKFSRIPVYNFNECEIIYSKKFVSDKHFCAGYSNERSGACKRDVGGPAVVNDKLYGVVSFGPPVCGTPDGPTVFTNIGYYAGWIDSVIKGNSNKIHMPMSAAFMGNSSAVVRSHLDRQLDTQRIFPDKKMSKDLRLGLIKSRAPKLRKPMKRTEPKYTEVIKLLAFVLRKLFGSDVNDYEYPEEEQKTDPNSYLWTTTTFNLYQYPLYNLSVEKTSTTSTAKTKTTENFFKEYKKYTDLPPLPKPDIHRGLHDAINDGLRFDYTERTTNGDLYTNDDEIDFFEQITESTLPTIQWRPTQRVHMRTYPPTKRSQNIFVDRANDILNKNFKIESSEKKITEQSSMIDLFRLLFTATPYSDKAKVVITSNWEISVEDIPKELLKKTSTIDEPVTTPIYRNMQKSSIETIEEPALIRKNIEISKESIDSEFKGASDETGELSSSEIAAVHNETLETAGGIPNEFRRYFAEQPKES